MRDIVHKSPLLFQPKAQTLILVIRNFFHFVDPPLPLRSIFNRYNHENVAFFLHIIDEFESIMESIRMVSKNITLKKEPFKLQKKGFNNFFL